MSDTNTTNYGFVKIDFNNRPWDGKANSNWDLLDSLLYTIFQLPNIGGVWRNSTAYTAGQNILDSSSLVFYQCVVSNTSAATGTFAAERAANPSYWTLSNSGQGSVRYDMGQALTDPQILQAQTNIALFARFLRFDAAQTLTYNNMLQVLNTLGIDGTESTIASAATTDVGNVNTQAVAIAGNTTITSFGPRPNKYKLVRFTSALLLTNSAALSLPLNANITTQAGDTCVAFSDGTTPTANWSIRNYVRADNTLLLGRPVVVSQQSLSTAEQKIARDNVNAAYGEDLKSALIQIAKLRGTALGLGNYLSDDFNDSTGIDTANATNANLSSGTVRNIITDANTKALLHLDGANNATTFPDDVNHTFSAGGGAKISTAQSVFGGASAVFASGDYINGSSSDFVIGTGDFSEELRIRPVSVADGVTFLDTRTSGSGAGLSLQLSTGKLIIYEGASATTPITSSTTITVNTWYAVQISRSGTSLRLFINGNLEGTATLGTNFTSNQIRLGSRFDGSNGNSYIDEYRRSNIARNTAGYTPASTAFVAGTSGNMSMPSISVSSSSVPSRGSMYALVSQTAGTLNMNTNMIFSASRDGGTTYTPFSLSNIGTFGGYTIYEQNVLDISAQPSGTTMRYKAVTNDVALGIAIDAVLFQWG